MPNRHTDGVNAYELRFDAVLFSIVYIEPEIAGSNVSVVIC